MALELGAYGPSCPPFANPGLEPPLFGSHIFRKRPLLKTVMQSASTEEVEKTEKSLRLTPKTTFLNNAIMIVLKGGRLCAVEPIEQSFGLTTFPGTLID